MPRWAENKGLTLKDMREMHHARIVATRAGKPLNGFLTMTPLRHVPECERRALFQSQRSRLGQRLGRAPLRIELVALFVREKKREDIDVHGVGEHCAALLWLPDDIETETLLRCLSRDIDAQLDWNNGEAGIKARLDYLQKERCGRDEGYLKNSASLRYPWEAPAPLISPRWSMSQGLAALVAADAEQYEPKKIYPLGWKKTEARALAHEPEPISSPAMETKAPEHLALRIVVDNALAPEPFQLSLFPISDRPVSRLSNYAGGIMPAAVAQEVEARRNWRGLTQAKLAEHIGLSRPQLVNALHGRFGLSNWAASRLREYLLLSQTLRAA